MKRSKLYTPEMDEVIRDWYKLRGGAATAKKLNAEFGTKFTSSQLWDRAKSLGLTAKVGGSSRKEPLWRAFRDGFTGPCPDRCRLYLITGNGKPHRFENGKRTYKYQARCLQCGSDHEMLQPSLLQAERLGTIGCKDCAQDTRARRIRESRDERRAKTDKSFDEWLWVMITMPVTPLEYIPRHKRFDSQVR